MYLKKSLLLVVLLTILSIGLSGQLNFKVGYSFGYTKMSDANTVHKAYNDSKPGIVEIMKDVHWMHGIEVGVRQKWESVGIEISYQNLGRDRNAIGLEADESAFEKTLFYSTRSYSIALENYFGPFGYGASIGRTKMKVSTDITGISSTKRPLMSDSNLSSQFYLLLAAPGTRTVSLTIKPYMSLNWGGFNLSNLEPELKVDTGLDLSDIKPTFFGISLLFYNGPQGF